MATNDSLKSTIFGCIVTEFDTQGLNHISSEAAKIVWIDIPDNVLAKLGNGITACLDAKGIGVPSLAVVFQDLKDSSQVSIVSDLISVIAQMAE
jgi:hypothetical protein